LAKSGAKKETRMSETTDTKRGEIFLYVVALLIIAALVIAYMSLGLAGIGLVMVVATPVMLVMIVIASGGH